MSFLCYVFACVASTVGWLVFRGNRSLDQTQYRVEIRGLPDEFRGYTIVQISDLHDARFGAHQRRICRAVELQQPDLCVVTGDIVASKRRMPENSLSLLRSLNRVAPVFFVTGNHEYYHRSQRRLFREIEATGAIHATGLQMVRRQGKSVAVFGVDDPVFFDPKRHTADVLFRRKLAAFRAQVDHDTVSILLSHRPEYAYAYRKAGFDLVFSGHVHGGVWRVPLIGGVFGPNRRGTLELGG